MLARTTMVIITVALTLLPSLSEAETIAIVGTGDVAGALGPGWAAKGHSIVYGSRNPDSDRVNVLLKQTGSSATAELPQVAAKNAEVIVLAVPAEVAVDVIKGLGDLSGKTVIDPTNAFEITEGGLAYRTTDMPIGVALQKAVPRSNVVKALNSVWYGTMADPESAGGPVTIPMAGNNHAAKEQVSRLLGDIGFESMDMGPIQYSSELEGMLIVWMNARLNGRPFNYYFRPEAQP